MVNMLDANAEVQGWLKWLIFSYIYKLYIVVFNFNVMQDTGILLFHGNFSICRIFSEKYEVVRSKYTAGQLTPAEYAVFITNLSK